MTPFPLHLQKWPIEEVANMWEISRLHPNPLTWGHKCKMYVHGHLLGYFCGVLRQSCRFAVILQTKKLSHGSVHEDIFHKTYLFYGLILYCKTSEQYTNWDQKKVFIVSHFIKIYVTWDADQVFNLALAFFILSVWSLKFSLQSILQLNFAINIFWNYYFEFILYQYLQAHFR